MATFGAPDEPGAGGTINVGIYPPPGAVGNCVILIYYTSGKGDGTMLGIVSGATIAPSQTPPATTSSYFVRVIDSTGATFDTPRVPVSLNNMVFPEIDIPRYIKRQAGQEGFLCSPFQVTNGRRTVYTGNLSLIYDYEVPGFESSNALNYPGQVAADLGDTRSTHKYIFEHSLGLGTFFMREVTL